MSVLMFDLDGADAQPMFEQMFRPVRPVLEMIVQDMNDAPFSIHETMEAFLLSVNGTVGAYNKTAVQPDRDAMVDLSGACLLAAANAVWLSFVILKRIEVTDGLDMNDGRPGSSGVH